MGAWIETIVNALNNGVFEVAPLVGAWIETSVWERFLNLKRVAPLVGAWIETPSPLPPPPGLACRTPRGCVD